MCGIADILFRLVSAGSMKISITSVDMRYRKYSVLAWYQLEVRKAVLLQ